MLNKIRIPCREALSQTLRRPRRLADRMRLGGIYTVTAESLPSTGPFPGDRRTATPSTVALQTKQLAVRRLGSVRAH